MANFGDVRALLQGAPSEAMWHELGQALLGWYGQEPLPIVLDYCRDHVRRWPESLPTFAPNSWFKRRAQVIQADPITPFFLFALLERTPRWLAWARQELATHKPLATPKFLDEKALGVIRWRDGQALDAADTRRLIVMLRELHELGAQRQERVRQLLHDADCQRVSRVIAKAWTEAGEPSAHRWALLQIATMGRDEDVRLSATTMERMASRGRHVRAKQLMELRASFGTQEALDELGRFVVWGGLRLKTRQHAAALLGRHAQDHRLSVEAFIERRVQLHGSLASAPDELALQLHEAMIIQRAFPWWRLRASQADLAQLPTVLWAIDGGPLLRFGPQGPLDLANQPLTLADGDLLRVLHPADRRAPPGPDPEGSPFAQLDRPVYTAHEALVRPGSPLPAPTDPLRWRQRGWQVSPTTDHHVMEHAYHLRGALWFATVTHNFSLIEGFGLYLPPDEAPSILSLHLSSVARPLTYVDDPQGDWQPDAIMFSEANLALAQLLRDDPSDSPWDSPRWNSSPWDSPDDEDSPGDGAPQEDGQGREGSLT